MQPGHAPMQQTPTPTKPVGPGAQQASLNGFSPAQPTPPAAAAQAQAHSRNSLSRSVQATPTNDEFPMPSPAPSKTGSLSLPGGAGHVEGPGAAVDGALLPFPQPFAEDRDIYEPCSREITTHGGLTVASLDKLGPDLERLKPHVPWVEEMGLIDLQALTRSIQCGIHGEVRLALDTLASLSALPLQPRGSHLDIDLSKCDDLVECLLECAEEQVELLAEHTVEVSDEILIATYEDVVRASRLEKMEVRRVPVFGSDEYELDRAVDRLICITTILRNLSFPAFNHAALADETVVKFLCVVIRYLGTRTMLLRTQVNTLDLMKDLVVFLSNVAGSVEIPGREQALCLLQFLLAFAPSPAPTLSGEGLFFSSYDPGLHAYLPPAVDALAKLLARDEPNRTHYQHLFAADAGGAPPSELITRTFGLAISPIPDHASDQRPSLVEVRKPFLMQGLLAADILASLAPGPESGVTKTWLACGSGFAQHLFRLVRLLSQQFEGPSAPPRGQPRSQPRKDHELVYIVVLGVSMLRRLSEKARDQGAPGALPPSALPSAESVLGALQMSSPEWTRDGFLQHLVAYAALAT